MVETKLKTKLKMNVISEIDNVIFTRCEYDADNRYIDLFLKPVIDKKAFILSLTDTSNDEACDVSIKLFLTKSDLGMVINRLIKVLENE